MKKKLLSIGVLFCLLLIGQAHASFQDGMQAYTRKDYPTALVLLKPEAEAGNSIAANIVGVMYMNALGVPQDDAEAMKWYRIGADKGYAVAQTNVGFLYERGRGVARDLNEARRWLEKASAQGDQRAMAFLRRIAMEEQFSSAMTLPAPTRPAATAAPAVSSVGTPSPAATATPSLLEQKQVSGRLVQEPAPSEIYFSPNWCPSDTELQQLSKYMRLEMNGCCIRRGMPISDAIGSSDWLSAWKSKVLKNFYPLARCDGYPAIVRARAAELAHMALERGEQADDPARTLAKLFARSLDDPKRWNEKSPGWELMVDAIYGDVVVSYKRFDPQREEVRAQREAGLAESYATSMTEAQLAEILAYYQSTAGQRFRAFLREVNALVTTAANDLAGQIAVSKEGILPDISKLPLSEQQEYSRNVDARLKTLRLSQFYRGQLMKNDANAAFVGGNMIGVVAARHGEAVDAIGRKYAKEINDFERFSNSETARIEMMLLAKAASVKNVAEAKLNNELLADLSAHRTKWLQFYAARIMKAPVDQVSKNI